MTYVIMHPVISFLFWSKDQKWRPLKRAKRYKHLVNAAYHAAEAGGRVEVIKK